MSAVVGVPRALSYYTYYPLWKFFLEKLGMKVLLSRQSNKEILESGIRETVNDACIPIKLFHGHVFDLKDRVDYLFIPRMVSADGRATFCPKFLGLPDMVRYSGKRLPAIIDTRFNLGKIPGGTLRFLKKTSAALRVPGIMKPVRAALYAVQYQRAYRRLLLQGVLPEEAVGLLEGDLSKTHAAAERGGSLTVALLGYPYALYDSFVSANLYRKLLDLDVRPVTPEQVPLRQMYRMSAVIPQSFFWYYSNRVCWSGLYLMKQKGLIDGLIHVTAFGCGPDAMVDKLLELECKKIKLPFLTLTIDEHTGDGGVQTRLEAFTDMLRVKKESGVSGVDR